MESNSFEKNFQEGHSSSQSASGEEVVITGVSGCFPKSTNVYELRDNLFNQRNMISNSTERWNYDHPELPKYIATMPDVDKFDAAFFGVHYRQAMTMDPSVRKILEKSFEAIIDAGMNPKEIQGDRTGVFSILPENVTFLNWSYLNPSSMALTGCMKSDMPQRTSYYLQVTGPSLCLDSACSSSAIAFEQAFKAIQKGLCDNALVVGCNTLLNPVVAVQFNRLGILNDDGRCKCFDKDANGYTRAETACVVFLQKAKNAKRIYGQVIHAKSNCDGYKEQSLSYPSGKMQANLVSEVYEECGVNPADVHYLEAHGTGTKVGDPEEIYSISKAFCSERKDSLLVGSVKSNIGHAESAAGMCSLVKAVIAMDLGNIPPNCNYNVPREEMAHQIEMGKMKVVTEKTKLPGNYIGVNSFGFGGANSHIVLKRNLKEKINGGLPSDDLPRLVCFSGRTEEAVKSIADDLSSRCLDEEYVRLLQEAFKTNIDGHLFRGYAIVSKNQECIVKINKLIEEIKPVCLVFSGIQYRWCGISDELMNIGSFAKTIKRIDQILSLRGLDIIKLLTHQNSTEHEENVIVAMIAMQLAFVDLLDVLKIDVDYVIGYSYGQITCAYVDKCLTLEQAIECLFLISRKESIAGLAEDVEKIITFPKKISAKWLTTGRSKILTETCSAAYLINSVSCSLNALETIPKGALLVQVFPDKQKLHPLNYSNDKKENVFFVLNNDQVTIQLFVNMIGNLYLQGRNPRVEYLYPIVKFPVSRGTPMISPLIKWDHRYTWYASSDDLLGKEKIMNKSMDLVILKAEDEDSKYITGHIIDGRALYPAAGYLNLVWGTLQKYSTSKLKDSVIFENIRLFRSTNYPTTPAGQVHLVITVSTFSENFEIVESDQPVVKGRIRSKRNDDIEKEMNNDSVSMVEENGESYFFSERDFYKELRLRGYQYKGLFRGVQSCHVTGTVGQIRWNNNYVTFMDSMLQILVTQMDSRLLFVPVSIEKVIINYKRHQEIVEKLTENETVPVYFLKNLNIVKSGGIEIHGVNVSAISKRKPVGDPVLETYKFVPNVTDNLSLEESMRILIQIVFENVQNLHVRTVEMPDESFDTETRSLLSPLIFNILNDIPLVQADVNILTKQTIEVNEGISVADTVLDSEKGYVLIVLNDGSKNKQILKDAFNTIMDGGFVVTREKIDVLISENILDEVEVILKHTVENEIIYLLRRSSKNVSKTAVDLTYSSNQFDWLFTVQSSIQNDPSTILFAQGDNLNGIIGLVNCLRKEPGKDQISCVYIMDQDAPNFNIKNDFYLKQLRKGLAMNVFKNSTWGSYRHLLLKQELVPVEHAYVNTTTFGDLSTLKWLQGDLESDMEFDSDYAVVHVHYASLNFRDVILATGRIHPNEFEKERFKQDCSFGYEYSGRLSNDKRVMGFVQRRGFSNLIKANRMTMLEIPEHWSFEDGATFPVVYFTVFYAFFVCNQIRAGETILIHVGSGGVGQAAINIALYHGLKVYTTVGTKKKREFIMSTWPEIKDNQIGNSRDASFQNMIMVATNGRGVDYVLNSLSEQKLLASVRCLAEGGNFIEIGRFDLSNDNPVTLEFIKKKASFYSVLLDKIYSNRYLMMRICRICEEGLRNGSVKPLQRKIFSKDEVEQAFRFMAAGKHIGKILINVDNEEGGQFINSTKYFMKALPRYVPGKLGTYVIVGGLGGFGIELADWLVLRGVRKVVLSSRQGISNGYQRYRIRIWRSYGVVVKISTANVTTMEGCKKLLLEANDLGPVESIFNVAVILKDAIFENQTKENFEVSFGPKAVATKYLDLLSRKLCPCLKSFVVFSSISCGLGNAGQTNYGMANSVMERICEQRKRDGYPALAIEWGAVGDVGIVANMYENSKQLELLGTFLQGISSCLFLMDQFLTQSDPIVSSMVVADKRVLTKEESVVNIVANILGLRDLKTISFSSTLPELGMDSITIVEIKQTLDREFNTLFTTKEIRSLTLLKLQEMYMEKTVWTGSKSILNEETLDLLIKVIAEDDDANKPYLIFPNLSTSSTKRKCVLLPGIEGIAHIIKPLVNKLDATSICLQIGLRMNETNIPDISENLFKESISLFESNNFTIVAHSFGTVIALELVALLEKCGKIGDVILLDGSPEMMQNLTRSLIQNLDEDALRNHIIISLAKIIISPIDIESTINVMNSRQSCDEKINVMFQKRNKNINLNYDYLMKLYEVLFTRIKAVLSYEKKFDKLKSKIKLIKPTQASSTYPESDYGLSLLAERPVEVVTVPGDHVTMLECEAIVKEINKILREKNS